MKILELGMSLGIGGAETHILTLSYALAKQGHTVIVATSGGILEKRLGDNRIPHFKLPLNKKDPISVIRSSLAILRLVKSKKIDVIHAHGRIPAFVSRLCRYLYPALPPVAVTVHGTYSPHTFGAGLSSWGDKTIAVSHDIADHLEKIYHLSKSKITVIPNGIELDAEPSYSPSSFDNGFSFAAVSRLDNDSSDAAFALCRAVEAGIPSKNATLTIVGSGEKQKKLSAEAERINQKLGRRAIVLTGGSDAPFNLIKNTSLFVGTARSALEAMSLGIPVLLAGNPGAEGLLTPRNCEKAKADNFTCRGSADRPIYDEITAGLKDFFEMPPEKKLELSHFCRKTAEEYNIDAIAEKTTAVLKQAVQEARKAILIAGYFGADNSGDEATLDCILNEIKAKIPNAEAVVLSRNCQKTESTNKVKAIYAFSPLKIIKQLKSTRLLVLGGGSLIQDATSIRTPIYYHWLVSKAKKYRCRTMIWNGGIGPVTHSLSRILAKKTVKLTDTVVARDIASSKIFSLFGERRDIVIGSDSAMLTLPQKLPEGIGGYALYLNKEFFVISVRNVKGLKLDEIVLAAANISAKHRLAPVILSLSPDDDDICRRLTELCLKNGKKEGEPAFYITSASLTAGQTVTLLSSAEFAITVRLHGAVYAAIAGTPAVCVNYDPKVSAFCREASHGFSVLPDGITAEYLSHAADEIIANRTELSKRLIKSTEKLRASAETASKEAKMLYDI